jgi:hypothetical protein
MIYAVVCLCKLLCYRDESDLQLLVVTQFEFRTTALCFWDSQIMFVSYSSFFFLASKAARIENVQCFVCISDRKMIWVSEWLPVFECAKVERELKPIIQVKLAADPSNSTIAIRPGTCSKYNAMSSKQWCAQLFHRPNGSPVELLESAAICDYLNSYVSVENSPLPSYYRQKSKTYFNSRFNDIFASQSVIVFFSLVWSNLLICDSIIGDLHNQQGNLILHTISGNTCIDKKMRQMIHEPSDRVSYAYAVLVSISSRYESKNSWRDVKEDFTAGATIVRNIIELATSYSSTWYNI